MSLLVRKINRNNWSKPITNVSDIGADAITQCMRTIQNAMSVFEIASPAEVDQAFLAIASNFDRLEAFDVVLLDKQKVLELGYDCIQSVGLTPVESLKCTHHDVTELSYGRLAKIAEYMHDRVREDQVKRRTKMELRNIIRTAVDKGSLDPGALKEKVKREVTTP